MAYTKKAGHEPNSAHHPLTHTKEGKYLLANKC